MIYQVRFAFGAKQNQLEKMSDELIYINNKKVQKIAKMQQWSELHSFVPVMISGAKTYNNYQPIIAQEADKERIIKRMNTYSAPLN